MKKLFTLIAGILLASSASAQLRWMNLATNSDMEGEQSATWSSFWCHDWRQGVEFDEASGQEYAEPSANATVDNPPCMFMGFAEIVEDPTIPGNHCAGYRECQASKRVLSHPPSAFLQDAAACGYYPGYTGRDRSGYIRHFSSSAPGSAAAGSFHAHGSAAPSLPF